MKSKFFPKYTAVIGGAFTAIICVVMNFFLIPAIEANTQGIRCFDMNFLPPYEDGLKFLELIGENGRMIYLERQLPLDFVYPLFYSLFFISLIYLLSKGKIRKILTAVSVLLAVSDYSENIFTLIMLKKGIPSESFFKAACALTCVKTILMYLIFASLIILLIGLIARKVSKRKTAGE